MNLLEALASGTPVVAPDDDMRRIIVGNAGMLCDVDNTEQYAQALTETLNSDWQQKPLVQASKFSWQAVALQYKNVIDEM